MLLTAPRNATSTRSGTVAKLVWPSSAAMTRQDGPAEPLYRNPAAVDLAMCLAVHGKRRLVAEIQALGIEIPVNAAPLAVFQD